MKEHMDIASGKSSRPKPSADIQIKMDYGSDHETDAVATIIASVIPLWFPHISYFVYKQKVGPIFCMKMG